MVQGEEKKKIITEARRRKRKKILQMMEGGNISQIYQKLDGRGKLKNYKNKKGRNLINRFQRNLK